MQSLDMQTIENFFATIEIPSDFQDKATRIKQWISFHSQTKDRKIALVTVVRVLEIYFFFFVFFLKKTHFFLSVWRNNNPS
jgi:hypothetical protein